VPKNKKSLSVVTSYQADVLFVDVQNAHNYPPT